MASDTRRVLLVEEGWHSTISLASALELAGYAVTVLTANGTTSTCRRRTVQWISGPTIASDEFIAHLDRLARSFDHVLPLTEPAMWRVWDAQPAWSDRVHPITTEWQQQLLRNKHALVDYMAARGIAVPRQHRIDDVVEPPVVVKGATGSGGRMVRIVETRSARRRRAARTTARRRVGRARLVAGATYLFGGLFRDGRPVRIYAAEKLEQHPPRTGGAIRLRSTDDAALVDIGSRVMHELRWTGFASADFMRRPDGRYVLLEVNPRLWGSLAGARSAGVDLFAPFAELLAGRTPRPDLAFAANDDCLIFPRYLSSAKHRNVASAKQAIRDLRGDQGRHWLDPMFALHILRRLYWMRRQSQRF